MKPKCRFKLTLATTALMCALALASGCAFLKLNQEVARLQTQCYITGDLSGAPVAGTNYAIVFQPASSGFRIADVAVIPAESRVVAFSLPWATNYFFAAFCDSNGNQRYDDGEPVWVHGGPNAVGFDSQGRSGRIPIKYSATLNATPGLLAGLRAARGDHRLIELQRGGQMAIALGEITTLADARFSPENGSHGLWEPASSLNEQGIGIYFLERYDPARVPVLFVHGAGGTPRDWSSFAEKFDRKQYQLWFYSYPSGLRLENCAAMLEKGVGRLQAQYGFERLHVVAHSMGGLVSRRFLIINVLDHHQPWVRKFVTIATPWRGHEAAALGVKRAPATVPSWIDMQTDSDFTRRLFAQSLAPQVQHSLAFTYGGRGSLILPESNDGTVSVDSQLKAETQSAATRVRGFNENHVSVLHSPDVIRWVEAAVSEP
ncbi:MAG TPA: alpha/beta fold hydrolase [Methylomirabilota bacterium]|nr:alpha/beta fold hydrolase [Methylomirabilota bacterium]